MLFATRLMKVAFTVLCVIILVYCRDLFVLGGMYLDYIIRYYEDLNDMWLMHLALKSTLFFMTSLFFTAATLWAMLSMYGWIDRAMSRVQKRKSRD